MEAVYGLGNLFTNFSVCSLGGTYLKHLLTLMTKMHYHQIHDRFQK